MALDHNPRAKSLSHEGGARTRTRPLEIENNGWNDLTQNWAFKHGFPHACKHRPQTGSGSARQPVPHSGLAAVTLILLIAFALTAAFVHCHSKLFRLNPTSVIEVAQQLRRSVSSLPPNIRSPDSPAL